MKGNQPANSGQWAYSGPDLERFHPEDPKASARTDFERDRARILHSAGLRRMGTKTQVMGPSSDDFVRTRLTHSLEVAQIGRGLAQELGANPDVVDAACLAHDLGHPPFGHNGEAALNSAAEDIGGFEGNAQTFRLVGRLEAKIMTPEGEPGGLNLTRATLDALTKYPWLKGDVPGGADEGKWGAYQDDAVLFEWMRRGAPPERRSLEAQIMDLSDDIAYSVHDFEDAIVTGHLDLDRIQKDTELEAVIASSLQWYGDDASARELGDAAERMLGRDYWPVRYDGSYRDRAHMKDLTSQLIGHFCSVTQEATMERYGSGPHGRYQADLVVPPPVKAEITLLKGISAHYVMSPRETEPDYFQQRTLVLDLVDVLSDLGAPALEGPFAEEYLRAEDDAGRLRAVVDQVASLTDFSASQWHARLVGMLSTQL